MASIVIPPNLVKELRERTGAGMMECKRALEVSHGEIELAIAELRKLGRAKADKKAGRVAAEGMIVLLSDGKYAAMVEVNSETDFVSSDVNFITFAKNVVATVFHAAPQTRIQDVTQLAMLPFYGSSHTVEEARQELVGKVGENIQIRRIASSSPQAAVVGVYLHGTRIGVIVELDVESKELAQDIAMHIAASKPTVITPEDVSPEVVAKEKDIYFAQAASSGKPQEIIDKMVAGRLKKFLDETSLIGQPFVKDPEITVGSLLNKHRAKVLAFYRFEVGEGVVTSPIQGG